MSTVEASAAVALSKNATPDVGRRSANFLPTVLDDHSISCTLENQITNTDVERIIEELKEEVRMKLVVDADDPLQKLNFIDAVQRLSLGYHFETEMEQALAQIYATYQTNENNVDDRNLYHAALLFRLLRQQGYNVSSDIFNRFRDNKGHFKEALIPDVAGMMSLYEAAHLLVHGEEILDEALSFCVKHLKSMATQLSPPLSTQIIHALKRPIRKNIPRLEAKNFMTIYQEDDSHDKNLLKLAKLDFNLLQEMHQKELSELSKWWKDLNFTTTLPFARDRMVECYFWLMAVQSEPELYLARKATTKIGAMSTIIDDMFDVYGTMDELKLLAEAVERWDISSVDTLPDYMKGCYQALLELYIEIENEMVGEGRSYRSYYARQGMKDLVSGYIIEATWLKEKFVPTMEVYMPVAEVTIGYYDAVLASFATMPNFATKEIFEWVLNESKSVKAISIIFRLMDDITSHEFEQKRGHIASAVECYMKQYGVTAEKACEELDKQVSDAWKVINQECLKPTAIPMHLLACILNYARAADLIYKDGDGFTFSEILLKEHVSSLIREPVAM